MIHTKTDATDSGAGALGSAFGTCETTIFPLRSMQIITPLRRTMISRSLPSNTVLARPLRATVSRERPTEAETARNSFTRNTLHGTSLFSIFCSATLSVSLRKQGFCVQSMGGGTLDLSRPIDSAASLRVSPFSCETVGLPPFKSARHCSLQTSVS